MGQKSHLSLRNSREEDGGSGPPLGSTLIHRVMDWSPCKQMQSEKNSACSWPARRDGTCSLQAVLTGASVPLVLRAARTKHLQAHQRKPRKKTRTNQSALGENGWRQRVGQKSHLSLRNSREEDGGSGPPLGSTSIHRVMDWSRAKRESDTTSCAQPNLRLIGGSAVRAGDGRCGHLRKTTGKTRQTSEISVNRPGVSRWARSPIILLRNRREEDGGSGPPSGITLIHRVLDWLHCKRLHTADKKPTVNKKNETTGPARRNSTCCL